MKRRSIRRTGRGGTETVHMNKNEKFDPTETLKNQKTSCPVRDLQSRDGI